jgi:hypothetical protein
MIARHQIVVWICLMLSFLLRHAPDGLGWLMSVPTETTAMREPNSVAHRQPPPHHASHDLAPQVVLQPDDQPIQYLVSLQFVPECKKPAARHHGQQFNSIVPPHDDGPHRAAHYPPSRPARLSHARANGPTSRSASSGVRRRYHPPHRGRTAPRFPVPGGRIGGRAERMCRKFRYFQT